VNDARHSTTQSIGVVLLWLSAAATLTAAVLAATGGFTVEVAGVPLAMHVVTRPVVLALALGISGVGALGRDESRARVGRLSTAVSRHGLIITIVFASAIGIGTYAAGAQIAGGADSSGYLSEARLWRAAHFWDLRRLRSETPLARELTVTNQQYAFTPVGYQPAGEPALIVPGYPPGLPLHLAIASVIGGDRLQFAVVPLCAAGLVIVAFLIGRRIGGPDTALFAAAATGASPMMLYQATQPMSDVVAAFWWSLAILGVMRQQTITAAIVSGVAAAVACAVRPNLFAMVPILAVLAYWWHGWRARTLIALAAFAAPLAIAAAAFVFLQQDLYGQASNTGYGEVSSLFSLDHVWPNLARYPRWAVFTQSALIVTALAAPLAIRRGWVSPAIDRQLAERHAWSGLLFFVGLQVFYLLYIAFDDWVYFRFLLPALPWILALQAVTIAAICRKIPMHGLTVILVAVLMASWGVGRARALGAFRLQDSEQRYLDVAEFARTLPPNAAFLSLQHSGSLAYYNAAAVLRWDWIEPGEIDRVVDELARRGRPVVAVLDDWEEQQFRTRFTGARVLTVIGSPRFTAGGPPGISTRVYLVNGTTTLAAAAPVSWQSPLAPRSPRTPGAPARAPGSANSSR
jgi:hypothetical protein